MAFVESKTCTAPPSTRQAHPHPARAPRPHLHPQVLPDQLHYAIVDEADSILIDESRNPMIISLPVAVNTTNVALTDKVGRRHQPRGCACLPALIHAPAAMLTHLSVVTTNVRSRVHGKRRPTCLTLPAPSLLVWRGYFEVVEADRLHVLQRRTYAGAADTQRWCAPHPQNTTQIVRVMWEEVTLLAREKEEGIKAHWEAMFGDYMVRVLSFHLFVLPLSVEGCIQAVSLALVPDLVWPGFQAGSLCPHMPVPASSSRHLLWAPSPPPPVN